MLGVLPTPMLGALPIIQQQPVAHAIFLLAIVAVAGLALGSIKYRGVALGTAGVIFAGIVIGHFGRRVDHATLDFVKEFGVVLFVFTIGLQLGPVHRPVRRDRPGRDRRRGADLDPGMSMPVRLGLAGGPLIVGIVLARLGHVRDLVWHIPPTVNFAFRELGITLFLAAVGLKAGERFFETVWTPTGLLWFLCALAITLVPLLLIGSLARYLLHLNYTTLSGLIAGSTTDTPALALAGLLTKSDGTHVAYATVYPLTMLLRIVAAQVWRCGWPVAAPRPFTDIFRAVLLVVVAVAS